jgi:fatty-acyl-CoA synthase
MLEATYIARICTETKAGVIVAFGPAPGSDIWDKAVDAAEQTPSVHTLLQVDPAAALGQRPVGASHAPSGRLPRRAGIRVLDFHDVLAAAEPGALESGRVFDADAPCAYFHTGGTTGYPKIAMHTHGNEAFIGWVLEKVDSRPQVVLSGLPLFHVNGALITGLWAFHCGSEVIMLTPAGYRTPGLLDAFWSIARRFGATTFSAVPTILAALMVRPLPEGGVPTLKHVFCGAAPLPRQVALGFEQATGVRIHEGYGLTEGSCVSTVSPPLAERRLGTVGTRIPYQELKLFAVGADGRPSGPAQPGATGVIAIRGPNVFPGYLREADNEGIWIEGGWYNTGDLGRFDEEGRLMLCGRAKELIIRGGHNIDPSMIEDVLQAHPVVAMAAVVGQPDRHAGELPVAYVTTKPGADVSPETLLGHARATLPERAAVPVRIELLPVLPLTAVGKVSKPHLRLLAIDHVMRDAFQVARLEGVRAKARLSPEGTVVDLSGPASARTAAVELAGLYPVTPNWVEAAET